MASVSKYTFNEKKFKNGEQVIVCTSKADVADFCNVLRKLNIEVEPIQDGADTYGYRFYCYHNNCAVSAEDIDAYGSSLLHWTTSSFCKDSFDDITISNGVARCS